MSEFVELLNAAADRFNLDKKDWINQLRDSGFCAAHPDDGWVNRKKDEVVMNYPYFNDGIPMDGLVALGRPDEWRSVRIVDRRTSHFGITYWKFEAVTK